MAKTEMIERQIDRKGHAAAKTTAVYGRGHFDLLFALYAATPVPIGQLTPVPPRPQ
jgi:hypothetical protein